MIKNIIFATVLSWCFYQVPYAAPQVSLSTTERLLEKHPSGFANLEHRSIGNQIKLRMLIPPADTASTKLHLTNGLILSYGDIVMFAGDFFGHEAYPVSSCSPGGRETCFLAQFDALATQGKPSDQHCSSPFVKTKKITQFMDALVEKMDQAQKEGQSITSYYAAHGDELNTSLNKLTCGGSFISDYIPFGQFLTLAEVNFDHFLPDAMTAYKAGHAVALQTAVKAYRKKVENNNIEAQQLLELAYAQNAFANHYLTDSFSAGHMRTPRRIIHNIVQLPAILKLLLANLMHDEDNRQGLHVVNAEGMAFKVYGDGYLYNDEASLQRFIMKEAMQRSADAVYQAFITGQTPKYYAELGLTPDISLIEQLNQTAPLFKYENGQLLKRKKNHDVYDHQWTATWSGLITLLEF